MRKFVNDIDGLIDPVEPAVVRLTYKLLGVRVHGR